MASRWVLGALAGLLIAIGVLGFLPMGGRWSTSNAPAYNVFHLAFGVAGLVVVVWGDHSAVRAFIVGFGLIDLLQALASREHWVPEALFRWTQTDDLLHLVIGVVLIAAGAFL